MIAFNPRIRRVMVLAPERLARTMGALIKIGRSVIVSTILSAPAC